MNAHTRQSRNGGMTALELVVVSAILSVLTGLVYATFRYQNQTFNTQTVQNAMQADVRTWLARMVKDIRRAGFDPMRTGSFGILDGFSSTQLQFTTDANSDGVLASDSSENIGYKFENGALWLWLGGSSWRSLISGVGGLTFTYRDVQGNTVSSVKQDISEVEIAISTQASLAAYAGQTVTTAPTPIITTGSQRTTLTLPTNSTASPILGQIEKATIRNPS